MAVKWGMSSQDEVIKWKHFLGYWLFVRGIHWSQVNSPQNGQWRRALMFSLICAWINDWVNNREAGDLRCHRAHYNITVMTLQHGNVAWRVSIENSWIYQQLMNSLKRILNIHFYLWRFQNGDTTQCDDIDITRSRLIRLFFSDLFLVENCPKGLNCHWDTIFKTKVGYLV